MTSMTSMPSSGLYRTLPLVMALGLAPGAGAEADPARRSEAVEECLGCHADEGAELELGDGTSLSLFIEGESFSESVHGSKLICTDCHEGYDDDHPMGREIASRRDYVLSAYETCKKCHFDTYTRTLESVHYEYLRQGLRQAPVCTDCHGAHAIHDPHEKQAMLAQSCARCHTEVYEQYARSVHGRALVEEGNPDVPACANCHTHHSIEHPDTLRFRMASPETCVGCHGDPELMGKYGIPTEVATTYLSDFHGITASLSKDSPERQVVVTCIDCHGVHAMKSPRVVGEEAMKTRVEAVCQSCHPDASADFPSAWLSHYRPSLRHAPMVFAVDVFYKIFIPFVVLGLVLQVALHLYRVAVRR